MRDGEHMRKKRSEEVVRFVIDRSKRRMRRERERDQKLSNEDGRVLSIE